MALSLVYEQFRLKRTLSENTAESVVEGTFSLPDRFPEIGRGLQVKAIPQTVSAEVREGRVIFEGSLGVEFLYCHFEETQREVSEADYDADDDDFDDSPSHTVVIEERLHVARVDRALPFAYALELPGVTEESAVNTEVKVVSCTFEVRPDRMSVDVDALVSFSAEASEEEECRLATGVKGGEGVKVQSKKVGLVNVIGRTQGQVEVEANLRLGGPPPERLLIVEANPEITDTSIDDNGVTVKGIVHYKALYTGEDDLGADWAEWYGAASFETSLPLEGGDKAATARVRAKAQPTQFRLTNEDDACIVNVRTPIDLTVSVQKAREVDVVTGLESDSKEIASRQQEITVVEQVGENSQLDQTTAVLELSDGAPQIEKVLFGAARAIVEDVHVLGDKVAVEVVADVDLLYVGRGAEDNGVQTVAWPRATTIDIEIPLKGAEPGLERRVSVNVKDVSFDPINRQTVEVRLQIETNVALSREITLSVVDQAIEIPAPESDPPTYTYVVVRPGDTVWKLAAYYRSSPERILSANQWLESEDDELEAGRKVCVPRSGGR